MTNNNPTCYLTLIVTPVAGTVDLKATTRCGCGSFAREFDSPELALEEWRAHSVRRSYARQFTNA